MNDYCKTGFKKKISERGKVILWSFQGLKHMGLGAMTQLFSLACRHKKSGWISFEKGAPFKSTVSGQSKHPVEDYVWETAYNYFEGINKARSWSANAVEGMKKCAEKHLSCVSGMQTLPQRYPTSYLFCGSPEK